MDEALVGGKGGPHKELVLVAAEVDGRVRLAHAATNDKATLILWFSSNSAQLMSRWPDHQAFWWVHWRLPSGVPSSAITASSEPLSS
jgi:hypothetical protein